MDRAVIHLRHAEIAEARKRWAEEVAASARLLNTAMALRRDLADLIPPTADPAGWAS